MTIWAAGTGQDSKQPQLGRSLLHLQYELVLQVRQALSSGLGGAPHPGPQEGPGEQQTCQRRERWSGPCRLPVAAARAGSALKPASHLRRQGAASLAMALHTGAHTAQAGCAALSRCRLVRPPRACYCRRMWITCHMLLESIALRSTIRSGCMTVQVPHQHSRMVPALSLTWGQILQSQCCDWGPAAWGSHEPAQEAYQARGERLVLCHDSGPWQTPA